MKIKILSLTALIALCATIVFAQMQIPQMSLTRMLDVVVADQDGNLSITLQRSGRKIMDESPLIIKYNDQIVTWQIASQSDQMQSDNIEMSMGEFSSLKIDYTERTYRLRGKNADVRAELATRLYNGALAYRFTIIGEGDYTIEEQSRYRVADASGDYFAPNGEHETIGALAIDKFATEKEQYTTPVIYQTAEYTLAFHEADLFNYPQLMLKGDSEASNLVINSGVAKLSGTTKLPWRVIMIGDNMADLQNQKPIYQSLATAAKGDFSWVKPGVSTWDWRVKGCTFDGFTYKMNTASLKRHIDFCARHGLEYFLIDDGWWEKGNPIKPTAEVDIQEVIRHGLEQNVGVLLYYDLKYLNDAPMVDFETVASTFESWGAKGVKYGFLGSIGTKYTPQEKCARTEELIQIAAKHHLIIDFHDNPIPFGGLERKYPNYVNREYCHAQLDRRMAFTPAQFVKMACVNLLSGMMDQTNGTFALNQMADREKGPRNDYYSTVAGETARFLITHTGHMSVLIDAPEAYEAKSDLFKFISSVAESWDESRYLEMEFDSHICVARRSGNDWFVGTAVAESYAGNHTLNLDFLESGAKYTATIYADTADSDCMTNKESYKITEQEVVGGGQLTTYIAPGGGYALHLKRKM